MIPKLLQYFEWCCSKQDIDNSFIQKIDEREYSLIINESNCYQPIYTQSTEYNSIHLSKHLKNVLCLIPKNIEPMEHSRDGLSNQEIIDLNDDGIATVSISIVAPDIRESDSALEWKDCIAKVLLIRSWCLPSIWGTSPACINMAESIGFILWDYLIPAHFPVI